MQHATGAHRQRAPDTVRCLVLLRDPDRVAHFARAIDQRAIFLRVPDAGARGLLTSPHDAPRSPRTRGVFASGPGFGQQEETMNTVTSDSPAAEIPSEDEISTLRIEIDHLDAEILRLVKRRSEVSQLIGKARMAAGGPRIVYNREMAVLARFDDLGVEGRELGMILLRLGRGRLGGR
jgi:chorismate mutase